MTDCKNWVPVPDFEQFYLINPHGEVKSIHNARQQVILTPRLDHDGYLTVKLSVKGKDYTRSVHRMLACAFLDNPRGKPFVVHLSKDRLNNSLCNLRWMTSKEKIVHARKNKLLPGLSKVLTLKTLKVRHFYRSRRRSSMHMPDIK